MYLAMRRINNKQDLANRITESVLKEMGLKHSSRRKALKENREQEILQSPPTDDTMTENKKRIRKIVAESLKKYLREDEERYMSDEDIASQYDGMKITYFEMKPCRYSEGWKGTFELEFPNADEIDYDSTMVNDFITYDKEGSRIGWDKWMPDAQTEQLENIIRKEIAKRSSQTK